MFAVLTPEWGIVIIFLEEQTWPYTLQVLIGEENLLSKRFKHCMICGRAFEVKILEEFSLLGEDSPGPPEHGSSFCPLCEAKIKKEAGDTQKDPKPI